MRYADADRTGALFPQDRAILSDEEVERILAARLVLPDSARVAVPDVSAGSSRGYQYHSPTERQLPEQQVRDVEAALLQGDRVDSVVFLTSLLAPSPLSIPTVREAGLRTQADVVLVVRTEVNLYRDFRFFRGDRYHAYSTVEVVLIDIRTGLAPFTHIVTRDLVTSKQEEDPSAVETRQRAIASATSPSMEAIGAALVAYLNAAK
ncbi:MAG: hypothetical protein AAF624_01250 [Bacteroidota bacterium]